MSAPAAVVAKLHASLCTIDTHIDTPTASLVRDGWDFGARHSDAADHSQCDLARMREGGIDALVFAIYVGQGARTPQGWTIARDLARRHLDRTLAVLREHADECSLALTADDGPRLKAAGRRAIYLSLENAYSVGRDLANVAAYHAAGVRMIGLTHMLNNDAADASTDPRGAEWGGLSPFGRELVAECNRLGIVLDGSHASDAAVRQMIELSRAPIVLSHSDCRAVCDHPRNVDDELLRALAARGGVIQLNALPVSLVNAPGNRRTAAGAEMLLRFADAPLTPDVLAAVEVEYDRVGAAHPNPSVTLDDFVRHIEHAAEVAGLEHVGIGCDFDGGGGGFDGLRDVSDYPHVTAALLARGWTRRQLEQLWGGNTRRVLGAVQAVAGGAV